MSCLDLDEAIRDFHGDWRGHLVTAHTRAGVSKGRVTHCELTENLELTISIRVQTFELDRTAPISREWEVRASKVLCLSGKLSTKRLAHHSICGDLPDFLIETPEGDVQVTRVSFSGLPLFT